MPILFLHGLPWQALSPGNDVLRVTWFPRYATPMPSTLRMPGQVPVTAVFPVPPAMRPLLQAVRCLQQTGPRLFTSTRFTLERIGAAAAHCQITLPDQRLNRHADLRLAWQTRITCTYSPHLGGRFDTSFAADQAFAPDLSKIA